MSKTQRIVLLLLALDTALSLVLHVAFTFVLGWEHALASLSRFDRALFMTYHWIIVMTFAVMLYVLFRYRTELPASGLGRTFLIYYALVNVVRLVAEFVFFGYAGVSSLVTVATCALWSAGCLYLVYTGRRLRPV